MFINNIVEFLKVAEYYYFELKDKCCVKYIYYDNGYDEIKVDLLTGEIKVIQWVNDVAYYPDKNYVYQILQDIKYLIEEKVQTSIKLFDKIIEI